MLNKKIVEIAWEISSSTASITGAVAAIADPPQIQVPTPISVATSAGICKCLLTIKAVKKDAVRVITITQSEWAPTFRTLTQGTLKAIDLIGFDVVREFNFVCLKNSQFISEHMEFLDFCIQNL